MTNDNNRFILEASFWKYYIKNTIGEIPRDFVNSLILVKYYFEASC